MVNILRNDGGSATNDAASAVIACIDILRTRNGWWFYSIFISEARPFSWVKKLIEKTHHKPTRKKTVVIKLNEMLHYPQQQKQ